jgi:hypothetical protein
VNPLTAALLVVALPGLIGESASTRWLASIDNVSSDAATPSERCAWLNKKRARGEFAVMLITLLVADSDKQRSRGDRIGRFQFAAFDV